MSELVDARGLSCPQPVLITLEKLKLMDRGKVVVLVDTDTSRENVVRAAATLGWQLQESKPEGREYRLTLTKE
ncbi:MAG: sulfurtransferase TusA family protein [Thermodesulfobacteriota bacterium]